MPTTEYELFNPNYAPYFDLSPTAIPIAAGGLTYKSAKSDRPGMRISHWGRGTQLEIRCARNASMLTGGIRLYKNYQYKATVTASPDDDTFPYTALASGLNDAEIALWTCEFENAYNEPPYANSFRWTHTNAAPFLPYPFNPSPPIVAFLGDSQTVDNPHILVSTSYAGIVADLLWSASPDGRSFASAILGEQATTVQGTADLAFVSDTRINEIPTGARIVIVFGGTNGLGGLGVGTSTAAGLRAALMTVYDKIRLRCTSVERIIYINIPYRTDISDATRAPFNAAFTLFLSDLVTAYGASHIASVVDISTLLDATHLNADGVHIEENGHFKIAQKVLQEVYRLYPRDFSSLAYDTRADGRSGEMGPVDFTLDIDPGTFAADGSVEVQAFHSLTGLPVAGHEIPILLPASAVTLDAAANTLKARYFWNRVGMAAGQYWIEARLREVDNAGDFQRIVSRVYAEVG